jgi:tRNA pseudouridine32 synthase/23S rRNA pseudouridine746 synthase
LSELIPSKVWLPKKSSHPTVLAFLQEKFPKISSKTWKQRMIDGKVRCIDQKPISIDSNYQGDRHIIYFREVDNEKIIPFKEKIIYENNNFLVVDKPHFLPVHPAGAFVKETLVHRLRESQDNKEIAPLHRIDRLTAGLIIFSKNERNRKHYQSLFEKRLVKKVYHAISANLPKKEVRWHVQNRIEVGDPWFTSKITEGIKNSESHIKVINQNTDLAKFSLEPISGKKHQLRLHLASLGFPILNDPLYPFVKDNLDDNYDKPLQLLAKKLLFKDPISGESFEFESLLRLLL